MNGDLKKT